MTLVLLIVHLLVLVGLLPGLHPVGLKLVYGFKGSSQADMYFLRLRETEGKVPAGSNSMGLELLELGASRGWLLEPSAPL